MDSDETKPSTNEDQIAETIDYGPYGPRGKDTPPVSSMFKAYGLVFALLIALSLMAFMFVRFVGW